MNRNYLESFYFPQVLHRDIKPANFLCFHPRDRDAGSIMLKLSDLGLSTKLQPGASHHSTKHIVGTMQYMAPENISSVDDFFMERLTRSTISNATFQCAQFYFRMQFYQPAIFFHCAQYQ